MQVIGEVSIDTHKSLYGHATTVKFKGNEKPLENVARVELVITPTEDVVGKLTLLEPWPPTDALHEEEAACPHVDLVPLVALLEEASCGEYRVSGSSWVYLPNGDMQVTFHKITRERG